MGDAERWKPVVGFEGLYEVSDHGRVRSVDRYLPGTSGSLRFVGGRILYQATDKHGYKRVGLYKEGKERRCQVHRLVASAFCTKTEGVNVVNHVDSNPSNNLWSNLEWTTQKGNVHHAILQGRMDNSKHLHKAVEAARELKSRAVVRMDGMSDVIYPSIASTAEDGFTPSNVWKCCQGKQKRHRGCMWRYAD